jgi:hypothetical protein
VYADSGKAGAIGEQTIGRKVRLNAGSFRSAAEYFAQIRSISLVCTHSLELTEKAWF